MDPPYWHQPWADPDLPLEGAGIPERRRSLETNYGPWDHLAGAGIPVDIVFEQGVKVLGSD